MASGCIDASAFARAVWRPLELALAGLRLPHHPVGLGAGTASKAPAGCSAAAAAAALPRSCGASASRVNFATIPDTAPHSLVSRKRAYVRSAYRRKIEMPPGAQSINDTGGGGHDKRHTASWRHGGGA